MDWVTQMHGCPSESWVFVWCDGKHYGLFLSFRPGCAGWRGFVAPGARDRAGLLEVRWSADVLAESGLVFGEEDLAQAQGALVRMLADRLGVEVKALEPVRNGVRRQGRRPGLSGAQVHQMARVQVRRR